MTATDAIPLRRSPVETREPAPSTSGRWGPRARLSHAELVALAVSVTLATVWLASAPTGTDLAAQIARADFAAAHPGTPVDLSWFGGTQVYGYSVLSPYVMALVGVRLTGYLGCVAASWLLARLFVRTTAERAVLGAAVGAVLQTLNVVAGRVTFGLGTVFALGCLLALTAPGRRRMPVAGASAVLCALTSPVAAFFLLLAAATLAVVRRPGAALLVAGAVAVPLALTEVCFGQGGHQPFHGHDLLAAVPPMVVVAVAAGARRRELRWGGVVAALATVAVAVPATPLGDNATRLSLLFALPLVVAYCPWRGRWLAAAVVLAAVPQQRVEINAFGLGSQSSPAFYAPLVAAIRERGPVTGRLEVPETWGHWDASALEATAPLARGWNRQLDLQWNAIFFHDPLTAASYRRWLLRSRVQYVAVPEVAMTAAGRREVGLVDSAPWFLQEVWSGPGWRLYAVDGARPVVPRPARLVGMDSAAVTFTAPPGRTIAVGVRSTRWTTVQTADRAACLSTDSLGDTVVHTGAGGSYRLTSTLRARSPRC